VEPYKLIKSRLLNGSHSAMACLGVLAGHTTTAQVMADPVFASFVETLMREEIGPLLPSVPGIDLEDYEDTLLARLGNPKVADTLARLCARGSTKLPSYLLPSVTEALEEGGRYQLMALAVAGWMRHLRGFDGQGRTFGVEDPLKDTLQPLARALGTDPGPLLELRAIFGDLWREPDFCDALEQALCDLDRYGARETVSRYLGAGVALAA
jgi:fructuronate reductase/mannitol 2-dehydrogenase